MEPLYTRIRDHILAQIKSNEWKVGDMLPKETDLCTQFGVSRPTVRAALLDLVNAGYLTRIKGKGTFISKPQVVEQSTIFIESFAEEMKNRGMAIRTEVLEFRVTPSDEAIAARLNLSPGESVIKLTRLRYASQSFEKGPIVLTTSYYPEKLASFIQKYDLESISMHQLLHENKLERSLFIKEISARLLTGKDARLLGSQESDLAIFITTTAWDQHNREIEYCESIYPADRNKFILKIRA